MSLKSQFGHVVPFDRLLCILVPLISSIICLFLGYRENQNIPLQILGWGSAYLTIVFSYLEYKFSRQGLGKTYEVLQESGDPIQKIIGLLNDVKSGDEIYSVATVPSYPDYENAYIEAVERACTGASQSGFLCLRIISNQKKRPEMKTMYEEMSNFKGKYSCLHAHRERIRVVGMDMPFGIDPLVIANKTSTVGLLGIKEAAPNSYFSNMIGRHIDRGRTYVFRNDDIANSLYSFFATFMDGEIN